MQFLWHNHYPIEMKLGFINANLPFNILHDIFLVHFDQFFDSYVCLVERELKSF